jgi:carbonic anhydrase
MKCILAFTAALLYSAMLLAGTNIKSINNAWTYTQTSETLKAMTPQVALQRLQDGNNRLVSGKMKKRDLLQQAELTHRSQFPFAFILSCVDSRVSPELIFNQGLGDVFSGRVAGNVVNEDQLGGMEFATNAVGSHIIVVMGHTSCGAVRGACGDVEMGNLTQLLNKIKPAVDTVKKNKGVDKLDCNDAQTIDAIAKQNVMNMMQEIKEHSPLVNDLVNQKQVMVIGAMHDLKTGRVSFFK